MRRTFLMVLATFATSVLGCSSAGNIATTTTGAFSSTGGAVTSNGGGGVGGTSTMATGGASMICEPGATQTCVGPGACLGGQACNIDGMSWGVCDCGNAAGGAPSIGGAYSVGGVVYVFPTGGAAHSTGGLGVIYLTGGAIGTGGAITTGGRSPTGGTQATGGAVNTCITGTLNCACYSSGACASGLICNTTINRCVSELLATGGSTAAGGTTATGGTKATGGSTPQPADCIGLAPPSATGTLSVSSGYVTTGTLKGYGFTAIADRSNSTTCVTPRCDTTGCTPSFGSTALCAAGVTTADTTYNSEALIGFNINQPSSGDTRGSVQAPSSVTITVTTGSGTGDAAARVELVDASNNVYCVEAGKWASGVAIPIADFNTKCWDYSGTPLGAGTPLIEISLEVPSDSTADRSFALCLTGVTFG